MNRTNIFTLLLFSKLSLIDRIRKIMKRKVENSEMTKIKKIKISKENIPKIKIYIESIKIINNTYRVGNIASTYIEEVNYNEIIIEEKEFKMNLNEMYKGKNLFNNIFSFKRCRRK